MNHIVYDESGTLLPGVFYSFAVVGEDMVDCLGEADDSWVVSPRVPTEDELDLAKQPGWLHAEVISVETKYVGDCPVDKSHYREMIVQPNLVDLWYGPRIAHFITESSGIPVCGESSKNRLEKSGLKGLKSPSSAREQE